MTAPTCPCRCHDGLYAACDIDGGCGSVGCDYGAGSRPQDRRCARGEHCALRRPERDEDGTPTGAWLAAQIDTERGLCAGCVDLVQDALNHLTLDYVELTTLLGHSDNGALEVKVGGSSDLQVPVRLGVAALCAEIDDELQNWAEPVAEILGVGWDTWAMGNSRPGPRVERAVNLLKTAVDTLLGLGDQEHPAWRDGEPTWAPEFLPDLVQDTVIRDGVAGAVALLNLHRRAFATALRTECVQRFNPQRCTRCGLPALVRRNGEDCVVCQNCREVTPWDMIPFFCRVQIDCERALREEEEHRRQAAAA